MIEKNATIGFLPQEAAPEGRPDRVFCCALVYQGSAYISKKSSNRSSRSHPTRKKR